jgi:hypothetical protein
MWYSSIETLAQSKVQRTRYRGQVQRLFRGMVPGPVPGRSEGRAATRRVERHRPRRALDGLHERPFPRDERFCRI